MKLIFELPQKENGIIEKRLGTEEVLYCIPYDVDFKGNFAEGWMVVTQSRIILLLNGSLEDEFEISRGSNYKAVTYTGSGVLEGNFDGTLKPVTGYSMTHVPRYMYMARILNELAEGKIPKIFLTEDDHVCSQCGRAFIRGTHICPFCTSRIKIIKRLFKISKPHWHMYLLVISIFWAITGLSMIPPFINRHLVDDYLIQGKRELASILLLVGGLFACAALNTVLVMVRGRIMARIGGLLSMDLKNMVYKKIQSLSLGYLDKRKTGDLMNRINGDTREIQSFIQDHGAMGVNEIILLIAVGIYLFLNNWLLALFVFIPVPFVAIACRKLGTSIGRKFRTQRRVWDKTNSFLQDILSGIRVVKAFGQEKRGIERFGELNREYADVTINNEKYYNTLFPIINFILGAGNFLVLYMGGKLVLGNNMSIGELVQFCMYANYVYKPLRWLGFMPRWFSNAMIGAERIFEVIDEEPEIKDDENPIQHGIRGKVTFRGVTFGYKSYEPVLKDISINVEKGEMIGIVGRSGAGKSTVINLIMRLYDADEGEVLIDGIDIKKLSQKDFRSQLGVVLQETFLFSGTIYENIIYAKSDASYEDVIRAAKIANAHEFIVKFPDGYDTKVGERGQRLSGGERQRIAIARAIINDPKILILDEATASVDTETEQKIQEALGRLVKNRTTFAIAHRLSTLKSADRLMIIDNGSLVEVGTHDELFKAKGLYHDLVVAQRKMSRMQGA